MLRFINQDEARLDTLKNLDPHSVLLVLDWAMKYLPRKYREGQTDLFGKRGISWHITTATRMYEGQLQMLSFVHIFQSCNQDSNTVFDDVLKQLKEQCPKSIASTVDGKMLDATRAHLHYWQFSKWPKTTISA